MGFLDFFNFKGKNLSDGWPEFDPALPLKKETEERKWEGAPSPLKGDMFKEKGWKVDDWSTRQREKSERDEQCPYENIDCGECSEKCGPYRKEVDYHLTFGRDIENRRTIING